MAEVKVKYFAMLREMAGTNEESVALEPNDTGRTVYERLAAKYHFTLKPAHLRLAVNQKFVAFDERLKSNDEVVFIPPVAGG